MLRLRPTRVLAFGTALFALGCGGKVPNDAVADSDAGISTPPPSCGTVCGHIVGACVPGASTADCVAGCEKTRDRFMSCPAPVASYLRCLGSTRVTCTPGHVEILDCTDAFNALAACP
jgi:hypothetical protein